MPRDTSLDEFLDGDDGDDGDDDAPDPVGTGSQDPEEADSQDPEVTGSQAQDGEPASDPSPEDADEGAEDADESDDGGGGESDEPESGSPALPDPAAVGPARSTYAWRPEGGDCEDCGATVTRRWRAGDGDDRLVCDDCKEW